MKRYQRISTTKNKIMTGCVSASLIGAMLSFGVPASANTTNSNHPDSNQVNTNTTKQSNPQNSGQANTDTTKQTENNSDIEKNNANENNNNSLDDYKKDEEERIEYGYRPNHWGDVAYTYENGTLTLLGNDSGGEGEISNNYPFDLTKRITENVQKIVINGPIKLPEESNDIFSNLPKMTSINLPNLETPRLSAGYWMFNNDDQLRYLNIPKLDLRNADFDNVIALNDPTVLHSDEPSNLRVLIFGSGMRVIGPFQTYDGTNDITYRMENDGSVWGK